jgi:hypothetical protein
MPTQDFPVPAPQVVGGVPHVHSGKNNHPINRVVIHSAVMKCVPGGARQLGNMNQHSTTGSWHYATDPVEAIQCSYDSYVCWHAPPNPHSLGIEMADYPVPFPSGRRTRAWWHRLKQVWRWRGPNHRKMLHVTAKLTAELLLGYDLPIEFLGVRDLRAGKRGFTTHANVSKAFGESTHWDPGAWPRRKFVRLVKRYARELTITVPRGGSHG